MPLPSAVDLVVIGAGVNGAAIARDAAHRGLDTLLVDAQDLCAGTSAASSRMIHGGLRYVEHFEFRLVRESLRERERLIHMAPHLVSPFGLLVPFYRHNKRPVWMLRAGMILYDVLSYDKTTPRHSILSKADVARLYPGINQDGLVGAALYFDAQALDAERLVVEQAIDAASAGATILTHNRVTRLTPRRVGGATVTLLDTVTGLTSLVEAEAIVAAAGPWVDLVFDEIEGVSVPRLMGGTKGSHITVKTFPGAPATGVHYEARSDARAILVLPIEPGYVLIGSTDIFYDGDPGKATCSDEEISYLLAEVNQLIPTANLRAEDVLHSYAGIRPLPFDPKAKSEAEVSRDHHVVEVPGAPGVFGVTGGKLTTHAALGKLAVDKVTKYLARRPGSVARYPKSNVASLPLPGGRTGDWKAYVKAFAAKPDVDPVVAARLLKLYGVRAERVLEVAKSEPPLSEIIPGTNDILAAEVAVAMREEYARTLVDVMARRLLLTRRDDVGLSVAPAVAAVCAAVADWDPARVEAELAAFREWVRLLRPRVLETHRPSETSVTPDRQLAEVTP